MSQGADTTLPPGPADAARALPTLSPDVPGAIWAVLAWPSGALAPRPALSAAFERARPFLAIEQGGCGTAAGSLAALRFL